MTEMASSYRRRPLLAVPPCDALAAPVCCFLPSCCLTPGEGTAAACALMGVGEVLAGRSGCKASKASHQRLQNCHLQGTTPQACTGRLAHGDAHPHWQLVTGRAVREQLHIGHHSVRIGA